MNPKTWTLHLFFLFFVFVSLMGNFRTGYTEENRLNSIASFSTLSPPSKTASNDPVQAELWGEEESLQPGRPFWLLIRLQIEKHWHAYWKNPGETGFPISIEWTLPSGFQTAPTNWQAPERMILNSTVAYGYEDEVFFLTKVIPPENLSSTTTVDIQATVRWLACSDATCLPGDSEISLKLPVADTDPKINEKTMTAFAKARVKLPTKTWSLRAERKNDTIELTIAAQGLRTTEVTKAYFFPEEKNVIDPKGEPTLTKNREKAGHYFLALPVSRDNSASLPSTLKGILSLQQGKAKNILSETLDVEIPIENSISLPVSLKDTPQDASSKEMAIADTDTIQSEENTSSSLSFKSKNFQSPSEESIGWAIFFAFIGGMILNLMPCVLPVISLKIFNFIHMAGQSRTATFKHGLIFSIGVLMSFWLLAGCLLILQAYGQTVGWGFQLQEPLFVGILASVLLVFGLSLFGVFEMGALFASWAGQTQSSSSGLAGSFFSGVLATAVATPCTGPFLGSAIGFAMTQPPLASMLVFTSLGLGMAFPYLILSAFPSLMSFLPKPGAWMITLKEIMGFFMLATALWLVWVFGAQTDTFAVFLLLVAFLCFGIGCWIYGKWGLPTKKALARWTSLGFATVFFVVGIWIIFNSASVSMADQDMQGYTNLNSPSENDWQPFSPEKVIELQNQGIPVLIDFTAKWCLSCQANHLVLSSKEVKNKLNELGVVKMLADWTRNDPIITEELRKFGRTGVPLYILYGQNASEQPTILPQILTTGIVLEHLKKIDTK